MGETKRSLHRLPSSVVYLLVYFDILPVFNFLHGVVLKTRPLRFFSHTSSPSLFSLSFRLDLFPILFLISSYPVTAQRPGQTYHYLSLNTPLWTPIQSTLIRLYP
ncbi:hypothetical protein BDV19DRAFT_211507 [Aspergillus venezuelensis]